jgi:hypothetical protein
MVKNVVTVKYYSNEIVAVENNRKFNTIPTENEGGSSHDIRSGRLDRCPRPVDVFEVAWQRIRRLAVNGLDLARIAVSSHVRRLFSDVAMKSSIVVADWPGHVSSLPTWFGLGRLPEEFTSYT